MTTSAAAAPPRLRVVLVHWNQPRTCADSVGRFLDQGPVAAVTVVDNGSSAPALGELRAALRGVGRRVELIETGRNLGFGPGANVGLQRFLDDDGGAEWVALAPHDVEPGPGCLTAMLEAARAEPMAGLMCADVGDGMVPVIDPYFGGMAVPRPGPPPDPADPPWWERVDYPHGTLMMLRRACLEEIGLFDERYFSYCEEADLALRARRAGWQVGLVRGARVTNVHVGSSIRLVDYLQTRNTLLLVREMSGPYHAFVRACFTLVQTYRGWRDASTRPLVFDARARLAGLRDFLAHRFGPPPASIAAPPTPLDDRRS